jgi:hypothetical protein
MVVYKNITMKINMKQSKKFFRRIWKVMKWLKDRRERNNSHPFHFSLQELKRDTNLSLEELRAIFIHLFRKERIIDINGVYLDKEKLTNDIPKKDLDIPSTSWESITTSVSPFLNNQKIFSATKEINISIYESPFEKYSQVLAKLLRKQPLQFEISPSPKIRELIKNDGIICGKLKFNPESGDFIYGKLKGNFPPNTQEFNVLLKLLVNKNRQAKYDTLLGEMYPQKKGQKFATIHRMELNRVIKNIKYRLRILPREKRINRDIFKALKNWGGYKLICE